MASWEVFFQALPRQQRSLKPRPPSEASSTDCHLVHGTFFTGIMPDTRGRLASRFWKATEVGQCVATVEGAPGWTCEAVYVKPEVAEETPGYWRFHKHGLFTQESD